MEIEKRLLKSCLLVVAISFLVFLVWVCIDEPIVLY